MVHSQLNVADAAGSDLNYIGAVHDRPQDNALLAALPTDDYVRIRKRLDRTVLDHDVIYRQDTAMGRALFPATGLLGVLVELETGRVVEGGMIGAEGMAGLALYGG